MQMTPSDTQSIIPGRRALRVNEFCESYGVSRRAFYRLMEAGKVQTCRIGGRRFITTEAIEALLKGVA